MDQLTSVRPLTDGPAINEMDNEDEVLEAEEEVEADGAEDTSGDLGVKSR